MHRAMIIGLAAQAGRRSWSRRGDMEAAYMGPAAGRRDCTSVSDLLLPCTACRMRRASAPLMSRERAARHASRAWSARSGMRCGRSWALSIWPASGRPGSLWGSQTGSARRCCPPPSVSSPRCGGLASCAGCGALWACGRVPLLCPAARSMRGERAQQEHGAQLVLGCAATQFRACPA